MIMEAKIIFNKALKVNSYAKVNLFLDVIRKMPDPAGYHEIVTLFSSVELCDNLHFYISKIEHTPDYVARLFKLPYKKISSGAFNLAAENIKVILVAEDETEKCFSVPVDGANTVAVAVKKLFSHLPFRRLAEPCYVYILFDKKIPTGAGLGGGSSNAAAALRSLNYLFGFDYPEETLIAISEKVGADVAFTLRGGAAIAFGIGDRFHAAYDFTPWPLVIVYPNFEVSSKDAYAAVKNFVKYDLAGVRAEDEERLRGAAIARAEKTAALLGGGAANFSSVGASLYNKLEEPVFARKHQIRDLKESLCSMGYKNVLMTGSGSSIYALLDPGDPPEAHAAHFERIRNEMHRKYSKTYKIILTRTRRAAAWEKILS